MAIPLISSNGHDQNIVLYHHIAKPGPHLPCIVFVHLSTVALLHNPSIGLVQECYAAAAYSRSKIHNAAEFSPIQQRAKSVP